MQFGESIPSALLPALALLIHAEVYLVLKWECVCSAFSLLN